MRLRIMEKGDDDENCFPIGLKAVMMAKTMY